MHGAIGYATTVPRTGHRSVLGRFALNTCLCRGLVRRLDGYRWVVDVIYLYVQRVVGPLVRETAYNVVFLVYPDRHIVSLSFGIHEFCMVCEKCARLCPSQAIPYGQPTGRPLSICNNAGFRKWYIDAEKCFIYWHHNRRKWEECIRCVNACPWTKPKGGIHFLARWASINVGRTVKKAMVRLDELLGYGKRLT